VGPSVKKKASKIVRSVRMMAMTKGDGKNRLKRVSIDLVMFIK
jgi:hypothetical protein